MIGTSVGKAVRLTVSRSCTRSHTPVVCVCCHQHATCSFVQPLSKAPDVWFYVPGTPIKSLATLQDMYHHTVGMFIVDLNPVVCNDVAQRCVK